MVNIVHKNIAQPMPPPRTSGFPIIGSIPNVLRHQTDYLFDTWHRHGDIYELELGPISIVMLNHPDYAQHILRDHARNYAKGGEMWESLREIIGDGLASSEGEYWRRQRRLIQPQFHRQRLAGLTELMVEAIDEGLQDWQEYVQSGKPINLATAYAHITMKVIVRTMFGRGLSQAEADLMGEAMGYTLGYTIKNMVLGKLPSWMPVPGRKTYHQMLAQANEFLFKMIAERRQTNAQGDDLLSMFLNLVDDETGALLTDEEIRDEVATVFLAGYETTSIAMTWATHMVTQHPHVTNQMQTEVDSVLAGEKPRFEHLMGMSYARAVMEETMRLYPPVYWLPRTAVEDDQIGGYAIRAGQMVAAVPLTIHRHPDFWENPDHFDPQNFVSEASKKRHPLAWMPFGAGQRLCIGKDFALMEGTLILSMLLQRFDVEMVAGHQPQPALSTTLSTKDGVWALLKERK